MNAVGDRSERHAVGWRRRPAHDGEASAFPGSGAESLCVLLNATPEELRGRGGDLVVYRNWLNLGDERLIFRTIPPSWRRRAQAFVRKACDRMARAWEPTSVRRALLRAARSLYLPRGATREADLILSHICFPLPRPRLPVIWSSQGIAPDVYYERCGQWSLEDVVSLYRTLGPRAHALLIATASGARRLLQWCPELGEKVHIVPAPVLVPSEIPETKPSQGDGIIRLLFVGLDPILKGLPELLHAYGWLRRKHAHIRLDVVTRGFDTALWKRVEGINGSPEQWGLRIHPPLPQHRVFALMREADLFVSPTHADTYGLAAVEAMAHRCAVIISNFDPLPELFPEAEVGFLVAPGDVRGLVERLEAVISNVALLRRLQENARRWYLAVHDPARVRRRLEEVFERVRAKAYRSRQS